MSELVDYLAREKSSGRRDTNLVLVDSGIRPTYSAIRLFILRRDDNTCQACGGLATEVDHIWPRELGGTDDASNLRAICGPCNKSKGARVDVMDADVHQLLAGRQALVARAEAAIDGLSLYLRDVAIAGYPTTDVEWARVAGDTFRLLRDRLHEQVAEASAHRERATS